MPEKKAARLRLASFGGFYLPLSLWLSAATYLFVKFPMSQFSS